MWSKKALSITAFRHDLRHHSRRDINRHKSREKAWVSEQTFSATVPSTGHCALVEIRSLVIILCHNVRNNSDWFIIYVLTDINKKTLSGINCLNLTNTNHIMFDITGTCGSNRVQRKMSKFCCPESLTAEVWSATGLPLVVSVQDAAWRSGWMWVMEESNIPVCKAVGTQATGEGTWRIHQWLLRGYRLW